jgi:hypothetical protein
MIVTSISTDVSKYYSLDKTVVTKNVFNPVTEKYGVEYVQYYYNKVGKLEPTQTVGLSVDKLV